MGSRVRTRLAPLVPDRRPAPTGGTAWRRVTLDRNALSAILGQSNVVGIVITADAPTFFDIHGTGSAEAPKLKFWNSQPPALPTISVSNGFEAVEVSYPGFERDLRALLG